MTSERIIITGAASGIGLACVEIALERGMQIAAIDKSDKITEIFKSVSKVHAIHADVSVSSQVTKAFAEIETNWGGPATNLISAHGIYRFKESINIEPHEWHEVITTNQDGTFFVLQAFGRSLIKSNQGGSAVVVSSIAAQRGDRTEPGAAYAASKASLIGLINQLAVEWGNSKIRVNAVSPGFIDTPMLRITDDKARAKQIVEDVIPLQRLGDARDVAHGCMWLLSDEAAYITGANLPIDGGLSVI
jgi:NAD(P)-dependent dehydrogenase (short-subunit alcohol dehydrogenase family)